MKLDVTSFKLHMIHMTLSYITSILVLISWISASKNFENKDNGLPRFPRLTSIIPYETSSIINY